MTTDNKSDKMDKNIRNECEKDIDKCTVFVGNLPNTVTKKRIIKYFKKFGPIINIRLRSAPVSDPRILKKISVIKKAFHKDRSNIHAYIHFKDENSAKCALQTNGDVFEDHHLRVDLASRKIHERDRAVFIGNLTFSAEEDDLWKVFENCGPIDCVRIVRDQHTGMGKGFGYVNFKTKDSVELALQLNGENVKERPIRVSRCGKMKQINIKKKPHMEHKIKKHKVNTDGSNSYTDKEIECETNNNRKKSVFKKTTVTFRDYKGLTALAHKKKKKDRNIKKRNIIQQLNPPNAIQQKIKAAICM